MPKALGTCIQPDNEENFRGQFHCQLCPEKILLTEKQLEVHLQSTAHKRKERHFERAKAMGLEAYEAECRERAAARESQAAAQLAGALSKKKQKNADFWKQRKLRKKAKSGACVEGGEQTPNQPPETAKRRRKPKSD
ncbi:TTLL8 [Symbiodinium pilosum]|uniref:TTLL8 protein n=1 Tax=Symbiodinium pilosum TaxID=2952 RepID=A0A812ITF3_SYMPI|nr:TTLL8 [Symbiodinium pilosum]